MSYDTEKIKPQISGFQLRKGTRYYLFDGEGKLKDYDYGYAQRPTAVKKAEAGNYGIYDIREDEILREPDEQEAIARAYEHVTDLRESLSEAEAKLRRLTDGQ